MISFKSAHKLRPHKLLETLKIVLKYFSSFVEDSIALELINPIKTIDYRGPTYLIYI